jgi:hypothetical protein
MPDEGLPVFAEGFVAAVAAVRFVDFELVAA